MVLVISKPGTEPVWDDSDADNYLFNLNKVDSLKGDKLHSLNDDLGSSSPNIFHNMSKKARKSYFASMYDISFYIVLLFSDNCKKHSFKTDLGM